MRRIALVYAVKTFFIAACLVNCAMAGDFPVKVTDTGGHSLTIEKLPTRIVSVSPSVTDVIFALGAQASLVGMTYHATVPGGANGNVIVGGFFSPSVEAVERLQPDMIFLSEIHGDLREHFKDSGVTVVEVDTHSIKDAYRMMALVGTILGKEREAAALIEKIKGQIALVSRKVAKIPRGKRKRVMRLMGETTVMTPGDDSFQNEFIQCAGGIPPALGKDGPVVEMTKEEWQKFNPQVIYYCGKEWELSKRYFDEPGWKDVEAVRNKYYIHFPCELTCRASVSMGVFVAWLASEIYGEDFLGPEAAVSADHRVGSQDVPLSTGYVKSAQIVDSILHDFPNRTLIIDFKEPMRCLSSIEGPVESVLTVGNHSLPPPLSNCLHGHPIADMKGLVCGVVGRDPSTSSLIYTGAQMECLSVQKRSFKDMTVYALVTAGAESNAIRAGVDEGRFYEHGTINIIILANMRLTPRAMTRAIIMATEAKTAVLQDLDVRSTYSPTVQATGTGTDNVVVVEGRGPRVDNAGGHSKLGELIAKAVYAGVRESLAKQNNLAEKRNVFKRLYERKIDVFGIASNCMQVLPNGSMQLAAELEALLLQPRYAGFVETALSLNDAYERGLVEDLSGFEQTCTDMREQVAGRSIGDPKIFLPEKTGPRVIRMAFDALIDGLHSRSGQPK